MGTRVAPAKYQEIAALFEGAEPYGTDFRQDGTLIAVYREIKDARSAARAEDRSRENDYLDDGTTNAAQANINQPSELWREVHGMCLRELTSRTKDIELICWLAEACVRTEGIAALAAVLSAAKTLFLADIQLLHPSSDTDAPAERISALAGLNGSQDSDGTLVRPLYLTPLAPDQIYGRVCLWHFNRAARAKDSAALGALREVFTAANMDDLYKMRLAVSECLADINAIDSHLTEVYRSEAPSFRRLREIFQEINTAYAELAMNVSFPAAEQPSATSEEDATGGDNAGAPSASLLTSSVNDREQAFQSLLQVAAFFRRTEPHSSIPFALETIVRRGRMDFMGLLSELVPDESQRREVLVRAGIEPKATMDAGR
jgi:type VI secretion system protein ImpA